MSQHDLDLANQAGAAFRADLNNALQALASQNAGTSAPGTTYAHMWWMDTANDILKQRNGANDAWISVARIISDRWCPVEGEYLASSPYCTDTGAADAYVLATDHAGSAPTAYRNGDQYRFRAGASNTGASTVNINGLGSKALVTVTGVALPAGYIRTDVDTTITYDAALDSFVADREVERGSNANGDYVRWASGAIEWGGDLPDAPSTGWSTVGSSHSYINAGSKPYPADVTSVSAIGLASAESVISARSSYVTNLNADETGIASCWYASPVAQSSYGNTAQGRYKASGRWYE